MISRIFGFIEQVIKRVLCSLLGTRSSDEKVQGVIQFVKFGIVGLSNTLISYVIYIIALWLFNSTKVIPEIDYLAAQFVSFMLSVLWSFYWNNRFVFEDGNNKRNVLHALFKTYISYAFTGLFLNSILSIVWVEILHWSKIIAPIINLLVSVPLNFVMNKFWAFKSYEV
ncbi:MAG: GtrA family protein [Tyzzerella sp.]|nr:GtrA family protein [Tyzzerella sp.]